MREVSSEERRFLLAILHVIHRAKELCQSRGCKSGSCGSCSIAFFTKAPLGSKGLDGGRPRFFINTLGGGQVFKDIVGDYIVERPSQQMISVVGLSELGCEELVSGFV